MKTFRQFLEQDISSVEQRRSANLADYTERLKQAAEQRNQKRQERAAELEAEQEERKAQLEAEQKERENKQLQQRLRQLEQR
jgi:hypothetical protein